MSFTWQWHADVPHTPNVWKRVPEKNHLIAQSSWSSSSQSSLWLCKLAERWAWEQAVFVLMNLMSSLMLLQRNVGVFQHECDQPRRIVLCACSSAGFRHCCLFVVTAVRCLFVFQSAPIVFDYTADYWLGMHTTALSVVHVSMRTQRRNSSVFGSIHLNVTWEVFFSPQMKCINVIDIKL